MPDSEIVFFQFCEMKKNTRNYYMDSMMKTSESQCDHCGTDCIENTYSNCISNAQSHILDGQFIIYGLVALPTTHFFKKNFFFEQRALHFSLFKLLCVWRSKEVNYRQGTFSFCSLVALCSLLCL